MLVAVTGGTGFIGRNLVQDLLESGYQVRVITRKPLSNRTQHSSLTYFEGDLLSASLDPFLQAVDTLFHCAGEISDTSHMEDLHIMGTTRLINAASGRVRRWVQLSSTGAYGRRRDGVVAEDDRVSPVGVYETTKAVSDALVSNAGCSGAFEYVILRPTVVFGRDMPNQSLFSLLRMIEQRRFFFIGRAGASANYIHVQNVVHALKLCAESNSAPGNIFNLSDYQTIEEFVAMLALVLQVPVPTLRLPEAPVRTLSKIFRSVPGVPLTPSRVDALTTRIRFPTNKIESLLGYTNKLSMAEGVADLVRGYWGAG